MDDEGKSKVDELGETLYSRTRYKEPTGERRSFAKKYGESEVEEDFKTPELDELLKHERTPREAHPFMKKLFFFALFFFIVTLGVGAFVFFGGSTFISSKNVAIDVLGPTSVSAGEPLELSVVVVNRNNADLELANLSIQYPTGARDPVTSQPLTFAEKEIGSIRAGSDSVSDFRFALIGSAGEVKEIKYSLEYKVKGSNATFYKDRIYEVTIGNSPITLSVSSPSSVSSGDNFATQIVIAHNSSEILRGVMLRAEYPYGYSVESASPSALSDNNVWSLGDLSPGGRKTVTIQGRLLGEDREERTFRFYVGVSEGSSANPNFQNIIVSSQNTVGITRPSVGLTVSFNGDNSSTYMAPVGRPITVSLRYQNNLSLRLLNPRLEVTLSGQSLDRSSVSVQNNGFYDSASRINWSLLNNLGNAEIAPGGFGQVGFNFSSLASQTSSGEIVLNISLTGIPAGATSQAPITVTERRVVRISSEVNLSSKTLRSSGPFFNTGPIPPKVGEVSTYTAIFTLGNTRSDVVDGRVTARLGPGVTWVGASSFESEDISYDESSNTVSWNIPNLVSGTGFSRPAREVAFQVSLTPTMLQAGTAPTLVSGIVFTGTDSLTNSTVTVTNPPLTTRLSSDPAFIQGDDIVVR